MLWQFDNPSFETGNLSGWTFTNSCPPGVYDPSGPCAFLPLTPYVYCDGFGPSNCGFGARDGTYKPGWVPYYQISSYLDQIKGNIPQNFILNSVSFWVYSTQPLVGGLYPTYNGYCLLFSLRKKKEDGSGWIYISPGAMGFLAQDAGAWKKWEITINNELTFSSEKNILWIDFMFSNSKSQPNPNTYYIDEIELDWTPPCICTEWQDAGCISTTQRKYIRTCTPAGCDVEEQIVDDPSCGYVPPPPSKGSGSALPIFAKMLKD